jgi:hypothetical protein
MTEESGPKIFGDASLSFSSPSLNSTFVPSVLVIIAKVLQSKSSESITRLLSCTLSVFYFTRRIRRSFMTSTRSTISSVCALG